MNSTLKREPLAARLHFIPRAISGTQARLVDTFRGYFSSAPGWVLLTTKGRRTGLPREVLLPCARAGDEIFVISTYGWRSDWIKNLRKHPEVKVTRDGKVIRARAEIIEDVERKHEIVSRNPFFAPAPFGIFNALATGALRPLTVGFLRRWVVPRPVVILRPSRSR